MKIKDLALCALFAALMCICAWISLPVLGIPITLQTFTVYLALFTLGGRRGTMAFAVYLCLGMVGLPVFSGFQGGFGVLLGVTGGYIWGFLISCLIYWLGEKWPVGSAVLGMALCYVCGSAWYWLAYTDRTAGNLWAVILQCVIPYLLPDAFKISLARNLSKRLRI